MTAGHDVSTHIHGLPTPAPERPAEDLAHEMQALSEGVVLDDRVECMGGHYRIGDKVGLMPLMKFAKSAKQGVDSDDMEGLVAILNMLQDCIHEADWDRFEADMTAKKADAEDLMPVVTRTIEILAARPTRRPTDSSSGPSTTTPTSTASSSPGPRVPEWARETVPVAQLGVASRV